MHPLESYLAGLRVLQDAGTAETAGYPAFKALIDAIGADLKPKILCLIHPENLGAGTPDAAFFTADQINARTKAIKPGQIPTGGVAEIKGPKAELDKIQVSPQVMKYLDRYGQVLVSNYREFRLVVLDRARNLKVVDRFALAGSAAAFWTLAAHPQKAAEEQGSRLVEFLTRVLRNKAVLTEPKDVAWFFASHARDALEKIEHQDLPALAQVRSSFEDALGLTFEGEKGDHFFRSSLIQTLFYGVFSAWVLWAKDHPPTSKEHFNWKESIWTLRVPMISALFEQIATKHRLDELGLVQILENTGEVLNRVDRAAFFQKFQDAEAVQYFYEPFLEAFDPGLRKELGVWYTPKEVVQYMVARVDTVLKEELGIKRGLADEQVVVLDPCCGTGAYLVEVLNLIGRTLKDEGGDALLASDLRKAAQERVFGFELLPAPFVVSHLQLGLLLQRLGAPLQDNDRAGVFLTNALTGWTTDNVQHLPFPELEEERELAEEVKRQKKVLVILGNPPYNGFAGITESKEERDLTQAYRVVKQVAKPQGQGLNDLYVRFFRMAERKIVEGTGRGIVCFISNYSWLDGLSFTGMREQFLEKFDKIWIDNLNGDKYKTGKLTPEGKPDPSIFSTVEEPVGIQVGTAIALLLRKSTAATPAQVAYRNLWGTGKRAALVSDSQASPRTLAKRYSALEPEPTIGLPYLTADIGADFTGWPRLVDLLPVNFPGVKTSRDGDVIGFTAEELREHLTRLGIALPASGQRRLANDPALLRYLYRPFDLRWLYWTDDGYLDRPRPEYIANVSGDNPWLTACQRTRKENFYQPAVTSQLADHHVFESNTALFPLYLREEAMAGSIFDAAPAGTKANLSAEARKYLSTMGAAREIALFSHIIATLHTPKYRAENAGALRQDWPRIPLPRDYAALDWSVVLGWELRSLLDPEVEVPTGTVSGYRVNFKDVGVLTTAARGQLDPYAGDLALTAGWGHGGNGRPTMPGQGRIVDHGDHLDIHLNDRAWWANVPKGVWEYTLGGYQVIKKWLSYRDKSVLGRDLTVEEARYVTEMVRRIAAILALGPALDESYEAVKRDAYPWPKA